MKRRIGLGLAALFLACTAAAVTAIVVIKQESDRTVVLDEPVVLEIQPGQSLRLVARRLRESGLIESERIFLWMASWHGADRTIKYGRHEFRGSVTVPGILAELSRAPKAILRVTIPEGLTVREIARLLEAEGAVSAESYRAVACSPELRMQVDAPPSSTCAEGYLFPDTYDLIPGMSPGQIVDLQVRRFRSVVAPLLQQPGAREVPGPEEGRTGRLVTLASIVEKETADPTERPQIAAVFFNRLRLGMPLQTDPTVIYGVIDSGQPWDGNLTRTHLTTATPYNTYLSRGLPPGPICNPGRASIDAVLRPAETKDLYFVSRGDGTHEFNANLADHSRAVRRYQLR